MPYDIRVRGNSTIAEDAAVLTAFNNFVTALHGASTHKVDAGGSMIGLKKVTADEATSDITHLRHGDQF